ncbi:MAG: hypothetical protein GF329_13980 [Candidatus Lokiarchaeota archaeon]|nr:hypothetical protein [Candidatus Lokiarchaeota archaeon]
MKISKNRLSTIIIIGIIFTSVFLGSFLANNNQLYTENSNNKISAQNRLSDWVNHSRWRYRINITLNNPLSIDVQNIPVEFQTDFDAYSCLNNSIRLFDSLGSGSNEITTQIWNISYYESTSYLHSCTITFLVNLSASESQNYYLYYSNDSNLNTDEVNLFSPPSYASKITSSFNGEKASIENALYHIEFEEGRGIYNYTLKNWPDNLHSEYSMSPNPYNVLPQNSEKVIVHSGEYVIIIAYEDDTNITLYDESTGQRLDEMDLSFEWEWSSKVLDQYEVWRYPQKGNHFQSDRIINIEYSKQASMLVTSLGVDRQPGSYLTQDNYYSGTDSRTDDDLYSAYGQDLLLWVPRDLWITAYEPNTEVVITDIGSDGDTDDSRTLMLGTGSNWWEGCCWNTSRDPLIYTSNRSHPGNYYDYDPDCDPSGDDDTNSQIFDNDIVHIKANSSITVVAGRPCDNYQTEVYGKNQMQFYFPIMYRFRITATQDNTKIYWRNLTKGMVDVDNSYGGYDSGDLYTYQGRYPDYTDYIANVYLTYFSDYDSRHQLSDAEVARGYIEIDKGDTLQFYDWRPDYLIDYGTPMAARDEDPSQTSYHTIYDRWGCAPDFYKNNWANVTSDKPIKVYVGTFGEGGNDGVISQKFGNLNYFSSSQNNQYVLLASTENNTEVTLESSEGEMEQHTTITKTSDLDGDGTDEIIVGSTIVAVYNSTGNKLWEYPVWAPPGGGMERFWDDWRWLSQIYTEDLNGDSYKDIIITGEDTPFSVLVINGKTGKKLWSRKDTSYSAIDLVFGDISGDGISDLIYIEGPGYGRYCFALNGINGEYLWRHYMGYIGWAFKVEMMDIDNDSLYDMLVFGLTNDWIYTFNISKLINTSYWGESGEIPGYNTPGWRRVIFDDNRPQLDHDGGWYDRSDMNRILQSVIPSANGYDLRVMEVGNLNDSNEGPEIIIGTGRPNHYGGNYTFIASVNYTLSNIYQNGRNDNEYGPDLNGKALWVKSINPTLVRFPYDCHWVRKIATGDLDGDGLDDVVIGLGEYEHYWNQHEPSWGEDNITLYAYSGTTGELLWKSDNITDSIWNIEIYDYNSDGQNDVLTSIRGERNGYKSWYEYNGFSANITLVNGSNGEIIWYQNIADGTDHRWIRSIDAGNITGSDSLDLMAGTYSNNVSFYVFLFDGSTWNRANWSTQILPEKSYLDNLHLSKGEIMEIMIEDDYRGFISNSSKPLVVLNHAGGTELTESITWLPLRNKVKIESITEISKGPIFIQYNITWSTAMGIHTSDVLTFYADTSFWRMNRIQYFESSYSMPYTIINSLYDISEAHTFDIKSLKLLTNINEGSFEDQDLLTGLTNTNYSILVDNLKPNNNISCGLFLTEFDASQFVTLENVFFGNQYKQISELIEFSASTVDFSTPGGEIYPNSFEFWEYAGINKSSETLKNINNILTTNFIQSTSSDEIWHEVSIRVLDSSNAPLTDANVTIYNKTLYDLFGASPNATIATKKTNYDGYSTFDQILEGNYTIIASLPYDNYLDYAGPIIVNSEDFEVTPTNTNLNIQLDVVLLDIKTLYESHLESLDLIPDEDLFINAKICIFNSSNGDSIVNQTTNQNGDASFYLIPNNPNEWNYSIKVQAYDELFGIDEVIRVSQGFFNYTNDGTWESPLILMGENISGIEYNMNTLDNTTYNVSSEMTTNKTQIEWWFNLSMIQQPVDLINLTYRGMLNDSVYQSADIELYNFMSSMWEMVYDINENNTWVQFGQEFSNDYVDGENDNLVKARMNIENNKPILSMIDYIACEFITLTGSNNTELSDIVMNISLSSSRSIILNCSGAEPIYTYLNVAEPNQSKSLYKIDYLKDFQLNLFYNASSNYIDGLPDSQTTIIATIRDQDTGEILITCSKDNNKIVFNGTRGYYLLNFSTETLLANDYDVYINGSYPGYNLAGLYFIIRVEPLETSIRTLKDGIDISSISVYWNRTAKLNISYLYSQVELTDWTLDWQISEYSILNGLLFIESNKYELSIPTEDLDTTTYTLVLNINKTNYDSVQKSISIKILEIPTRLNDTTFQYPSVQVYAMEKEIVYFNLTNNLTGKGVSGAITSYSIEQIDEEDTLDDLGNGIYALDINTQNKPVGSYAVVVHIKKNKYIEVPCVVFFNIIKRPTNITITTPQNVEVEQSQTVNYQFNLIDSVNDEDLNLTVTYSWAYGSGNLDYIGNGTYQLVLSTDGVDRGSYNIEITCSSNNWTVQTQTVSVNVTWMKIFGIEFPYFIIILMVIIAGIALFSLYLVVRRAKIPPLVRKIDSTIKGIKNEKEELEIPVTKSKSTLFSEKYNSDWAILNLEPPIIQEKYLIDQISRIIQNTKSIKMSTIEVEKLINKIKHLGNQEIKMTLENMGFPEETIDLITRKLTNYTKSKNA